jgi:hypothetical protein
VRESYSSYSCERNDPYRKYIFKNNVSCRRYICKSNEDAPSASGLCPGRASMTRTESISVTVMTRTEGISVRVIRMLPQLVGFLPVERACMKLDVFFKFC